MIAPAVGRAGVEVISTPLELKVNADFYRFSFHPDTGLWDLWWDDGAPLVSNATSLWGVIAGGEKKAVPLAGRRKFDVSVKNFVDRLGEGRSASVAFDSPNMPLRFTAVFRFYDKKPFFTILQSIENKGTEPIEISHTLPLQTDFEHYGGFFAGPDPKDVWALENGNKYIYDFFVRMVNGAEPVFSNWNAAYFDRATHRTSLFGFITADKAKVSVRSFHDREKCVKEGTWTALTSLRAQAEYDPPVPLPPKKTFEGERLLVGVSAEPIPHPTLERFADAVASHYDIRLLNRTVPNGWNSWATKYHTNLSEEIILDNARWASEYLLKYGMNTFQIDDGWQKGIGDWEPNDKFPHGMKWTAAKIRKLGFTPGIWIAPFSVGSESPLAKEHPDWIAPKNEMAQTIMPKDWEILDLTNPEVKVWLSALFRRIGREWGYKVIKIDFIYYALLAKRYHDPNMTAMEAYREGMRIIKEALPPDAFLVAVCVPVANGVGIADGMRLGLDIKPIWGDDEGPMGQGTKPMVRNLARRYYLGRRVWINHPDMFYLGGAEETERWGARLTLEEARTYATLASLEGGIVKIGDSFTGLDAARTDLLRRILPAYPGVARPLDLFEHLYPEIWHLPIRKPDMNYEVVAFFNWGNNRRWGVKEDEKEKTIQVYASELGLDKSKRYIATEFWTGEPVGELTDSLEADLPPRTVRVFAVRELKGHPQFLGTNRHITQGATDIEELNWDPIKKIYYVTQKVVPGFKYMLTFYIPDGYDFTMATMDKWPLRHELNGNYLKVWFSETSPRSCTLKLLFE